MAKSKGDVQTLELLPPISAQSFLFEDFEERPDLVIKAREYVHNGKRALRDDARCQAIVSAILNGAPKVAVMKYFHVGYETLTQIYEVFEQAGRVRTLKEQRLAGWGSILVLSHWRIQEKLLQDEMPAQVLPMLAGISEDKLDRMTHSEGEETGQKRATATDGVAATIAELKRLLKPADQAGDSVSPVVASQVAGGLRVECSQVGASMELDTGSGAGPGPGAVDLAAGGLEGGGGDRPAAEPHQSDGFGREISGGKEGSLPLDGSPGTTDTPKDDIPPSVSQKNAANP